MWTRARACQLGKTTSRRGIGEVGSARLRSCTTGRPASSTCEGERRASVHAMLPPHATAAHACAGCWDALPPRTCDTTCAPARGIHGTGVSLKADICADARVSSSIGPATRVVTASPRATSYANGRLSRNFLRRSFHATSIRRAKGWRPSTRHSIKASRRESRSHLETPHSSATL